MGDSVIVENPWDQYLEISVLIFALPRAQECGLG